MNLRHAYRTGSRYRRLVLSLTGWVLCCASAALAAHGQQVRAEPPEPTYLATEMLAPTREAVSAPTFEISDPDNNTLPRLETQQPRAAEDSGSYTGRAIPSDRRPMPQLANSPAPVMDSLSDYLRRREEQEMRQLRDLKSNLGQLGTLIRGQKDRQRQAEEAAQRARRRETAALREAEARQQEVESEKAELRRLFEELERREDNLRRQRRERALAGQSLSNSEAPTGDPHATAPTARQPHDRQPATAPLTSGSDAARGVAVPPANPSASPITKGAVDQRALADNLFGAAEYKLAAEIYQQLLGQQPDSADAGWFRFQAANCFRHLGNRELAASYYREVVSDESDRFLAENAKWWLATIEQRGAVQRRVVELATLVDQFSNALDEKLR